MHIRDCPGNSALCKGDIITLAGDEEEIHVYEFIYRCLLLQSRWKDTRLLIVNKLGGGQEEIPDGKYNRIGTKYKVVSLADGNGVRLAKCGKEGLSKIRKIALSDCTEDLQRAIEEWRNPQSKKQEPRDH